MDAWYLQHPEANAAVAVLEPPDAVPDDADAYAEGLMAGRRTARRERHITALARSVRSGSPTRSGADHMVYNRFYRCVPARAPPVSTGASYFLYYGNTCMTGVGDGCGWRELAPPILLRSTFV